MSTNVVDHTGLHPDRDNGGGLDVGADFSNGHEVGHCLRRGLCLDRGDLVSDGRGLCLQQSLRLKNQVSNAALRITQKYNLRYR